MPQFPPVVTAFCTTLFCTGMGYRPTTSCIKQHTVHASCYKLASKVMGLASSVRKFTSTIVPVRANAGTPTVVTFCPLSPLATSTENSAWLPTKYTCGQVLRMNGSLLMNGKHASVSGAVLHRCRCCRLSRRMLCVVVFSEYLRTHVLSHSPEAPFPCMLPLRCARESQAMIE